MSQSCTPFQMCSLSQTHLDMRNANLCFLLITKLFQTFFLDCFTECNAKHKYNTRHAQNRSYFLKRRQKATGQQTIQYRGAKFWNKLPNSMKNIVCFYAFAKSVKSYLLPSTKEMLYVIPKRTNLFMPMYRYNLMIFV